MSHALGKTFNDAVADLSLRFDIPSAAETNDPTRVFFQVQEAHWFYCDKLRKKHPELPPYPKFGQFAHDFVMNCPTLHKFAPRFGEYLQKFHNTSNMVPRGRVFILDPTLTKVLLAKSGTNNWGIPGGKVNQGETQFQAAVRETLEEVGVDLSQYVDEDVYVKSEEQNKVRPTLTYFALGVPTNLSFHCKTEGEMIEIAWHPIDSPDLARFRYVWFMLPCLSKLFEKLKLHDHARAAVAHISQQDIDTVLSTNTVVYKPSKSNRPKFAQICRAAQLAIKSRPRPSYNASSLPASENRFANTESSEGHHRGHTGSIRSELMDLLNATTFGADEAKAGGPALHELSVPEVPVVQLFGQAATQSAAFDEFMRYHDETGKRINSSNKTPPKSQASQAQVSVNEFLQQVGSPAVARQMNGTARTGSAEAQSQAQMQSLTKQFDSVVGFGTTAIPTRLTDAEEKELASTALFGDTGSLWQLLGGKPPSGAAAGSSLTSPTQIRTASGNGSSHILDSLSNHFSNSTPQNHLNLQARPAHPELSDPKLRDFSNNQSLTPHLQSDQTLKVSSQTQLLSRRKPDLAQLPATHSLSTRPVTAPHVLGQVAYPTQHPSHMPHPHLDSHLYLAQVQPSAVEDLTGTPILDMAESCIRQDKLLHHLHHQQQHLTQSPMRLCSSHPPDIPCPYPHTQAFIHPNMSVCMANTHHHLTEVGRTTDVSLADSALTASVSAEHQSLEMLIEKALSAALEVFADSANLHAKQAIVNRIKASM